MRSLRWLILLAIGLLAGFVGYTYHLRTNDQAHAKVAPAAVVPDNVNIQSEEWAFTQTQDGVEKARIRAKHMRQLKDQSKVELQGVTLEIPQKGSTNKKYDRIKTERAEFDQKNETLYADGEVEIFMDVPEGEEPSGRLLRILTSGLTFEKAGKAFTNREVSFEFDRGRGKSVGALYDTSLRELHLNQNVELIWTGTSPKTIPMKIQCGNAVYKEAESIVYLLPWAKFDRGPLHMEAGGSVVKLVKGRIDIVETQKATGVREANGRKIEYGAEAMVMFFAETGQVSKITGDTNARLTSTTGTSRTDVNADKLVMEFEAGEEESALSKAYAGGKAVLVSKPVAPAATDTRIVKSDTVELFMRPGGEEIERAETAAPSTLELIPNRPRQTHRWLNGERFFVAYGKDNQIEKFTTTGATTRSEPPPRADRKPNPPQLTWSKELEAHFDGKTGQMSRMMQKTDFRYEAGDRHAKANQADLDQTSEVILLAGAARVWDSTGSTSGDTIHINQKNNDFIAEGNVTSTRLPEKKPVAATASKNAPSSPMMNREETTQALARKMTARNGNRYILYEGNAVAWQGSNRIAADRIEIDRDNEMLKATGNVVSQFADRPQDNKNAAKQQQPVKNAAPTFTVVKAPEMIYTESDRVALYRGGIANLTRTGLVVKGKQIRAYLNESSEESTLSRAVVDGDVEIVQTGTGANAKRTRTGTAEHADYYPAEEKTILSGGRPRMVDSMKGTTEGRELTYFANSEKLIVDGAEQKRTESVIKRR
ncbi:hypothetical protein F183_A26210 [Bryobacterales bacterium F-183]|nr:hypothetical protein F183_A26210 [Bryobacterales bacterium F-183]